MNALAAIVLLLGTFAFGGFFGDRIGVNRQKVADQTKFDDINQKLANQKTEAARVLATVNAENLQLILDRDTLKTNLEKKYADAQDTIRTTRRELGTIKLQFLAEVPGAGSRSRGTEDASDPPPTIAGSALIQLPDQITTDLRAWAEDADFLSAAYAVCYGWATSVK